MYTPDNQLGVFLSDQDQKQKINIAISRIPNIEDIFLLTDIDIIDYDKTILPSYYIRFYSGKILFMNIEDWLSYKDILCSKQIYLAITTEELVRANLSLQHLKNIEIINI